MSPSPIDSSTALTELGRIKLSETNLDGVLDRVASLAKASLPGAAEVSVTLVRENGPHTAAFTGQMALELDEVQYEQGNGPCLEAAARQVLLSITDTAAEPRWPEWASQASAAGTGSSLAIGLPLQERVAGALNVYGAAADAFDPGTIALAETFAAYAAVALANAQLYDSTATLAQHMQAAMQHRAVIEQAKGIIMGERRCTADEAFVILTRASQDTNRKLRDVAQTLVADAQRNATS